MHVHVHATVGRRQHGDIGLSKNVRMHARCFSHRAPAGDGHLLARREIARGEADRRGLLGVRHGSVESNERDVVLERTRHEPLVHEHLTSSVEFFGPSEANVVHADAQNEERFERRIRGGQRNETIVDLLLETMSCGQHVTRLDERAAADVRAVLPDAVVATVTHADRDEPWPIVRTRLDAVDDLRTHRVEKVHEEALARVARLRRARLGRCATALGLGRSRLAVRVAAAEQISWLVGREVRRRSRAAVAHAVIVAHLPLELRLVGVDAEDVERAHHHHVERVIHIDTGLVDR